MYTILTQGIGDEFPYFPVSKPPEEIPDTTWLRGLEEQTSRPERLLTFLRRELEQCKTEVEREVVWELLGDLAKAYKLLVVEAPRAMKRKPRRRVEPEDYERTPEEAKQLREEARESRRPPPKPKRRKKPKRKKRYAYKRKYANLSAMGNAIHKRKLLLELKAQKAGAPGTNSGLSPACRTMPSPGTSAESDSGSDGEI